ncbi:MAG: hypothetical protein JXN59_04780 [Anaerolineae bacterium]|nr:hypothetical protein [Anaerolineae bacterium]
MRRQLTLALVIFILLTWSLPPLSAQTPLTITIGTTDFPRSLDPATAVDLPSWEVMNHLYTGLTRQQPGTFMYELALAATHEISPDGLIHTFTIHPGAAFDDGTPITAELFAGSINRVMALGREGAEFIGRFVTSVAAGPGNTLRFSLHTPLPDFEALVALPPFFPQHPASYPANDVLEMTNSSTLITNGAYRLEYYTPDTELKLVANPAYAGSAPRNDAVILRRYSLPIDLRRALVAREVEIAWRALAQPDLDTAATIPELVTTTQPNLRMFYLLLNHNTITLNNQNSFDDPALREAIALLIDRETSARLGWDGTLLPADTIIPDSFDLESVLFPGYNYERADAVLEEAGYRPRRRPVTTAITLSNEAYGDLLGSAANELRRAIELSEIVDITALSNTQSQTFITAVNRGEYLSAIIGWQPHYASPAAYFFGLVHSSSPIASNGGYASPALDALLEEAGTWLQPADREALYTRIQQQMLTNYTLIPLWQGQDVITAWEDITGIELEANSWLRYDQIAR